MKYYIIAGEASGDLHGGNLLRALRALDNDATCYAWGGTELAAAGATLRKHYRDLAFMGFVEVVRNLPTILRNIRFCKTDILQFKPDVLVLIDYPGFNLRIAEWAHTQGIRVHYYISPQLWAWHKSRVHGIKKWVDKMYVILPFERDFYAKYDYEVDFVGHPLLDAIADFRLDTDFRQKNKLSQRPIIALLPGSRRQEIKKVLPIMLAATENKQASYEIVIAGAPTFEADYYQGFIKDYPYVKLVETQTYQILAHAKAALVTSGTATLETALFGVPEVVCYRGSNISYQIAKRLVDLKYISLVNLIADAPIVAELIQENCTPKTVSEALDNILTTEKQNAIKQDYNDVRQRLGNVGASKRCAIFIHNSINLL